jgi:hypothetical protein
MQDIIPNVLGILITYTIEELDTSRMKDRDFIWT